MKNQEFLVNRLSHSNQETVYSWLETNQQKKDGPFSSIDREVLENALLKRDEPLINLGLALFGYEEKTGLTLYSKDDKFLKKAVLAGTTIRKFFGHSWVSGVVNALIDEKNTELLGALLSNPIIDDNILINLYEKKDSFERIDDDFWYTLIAHSVSNPRLHTPYDDKWMDGWSEYSYSRVFVAGWELFEKSY
jgi:hypothetical protein